MKKASLLLLSLLASHLLWAQDRATPEDAKLTDMFLDYWPIILLPIFMLVVYKFWSRKK